MISIQKKRTTDSIVAGVVSSLLLIACCIDAMFQLLEVGTGNYAELQMTLATYGEPKAKNLNLNTWNRTFRRRDKNILQLIEKSVANNND